VKIQRRPTHLIALPLLLLCACGSSDDGIVRPKNLLLTIFDTTRADHLSAYGYGKATTPAVDALVKSGARFDQAYSQSSLTPVSAGAFLTGTWPNRHGIRSLMSVGEESLNAQVETLAERLTQAGLRSAAFVSARPMGAHYGLDRGFETYSEVVHKEVQKSRCGNEYQRRADDTTDLALEWLGANGLDPFFLMLHYFDAHDATLAPPREFLAERVSFPLPRNIAVPCALVGLADKFRVELYDAEIAWMDFQFARVIERLERLGVLDETLICVIADHGEGLGQHDNWTHGWLHREQIRVPLVLSGPGVASEMVIDQPVRLIDLFPTFSELFDVELKRETYNGISLLPLLDKATESARIVYAEVHHDIDDFLGRDPAMFCLEQGDWKYIHRPETGQHELYHVAEDPTELKNLYTADHPQAAKLLTALQDLGVLGGDLITSEGLTADEIEALEALGYLGQDDEPGENDDKE
jgi:arylsulfatase A-like enzyme